MLSRLSSHTIPDQAACSDVFRQGLKRKRFLLLVVIHGGSTTRNTHKVPTAISKLYFPAHKMNPPIGSSITHGS